MFKFNKTNESGRSMVEMLGVLAIMWVLSIGGISGYTAAMNTQRANDTVTHALRLATLASGKRLMSPTAVLEPSDLGSTGFTFANEDPDGFTLTISNLSPAVIAKINKMKTDLAAATVSDDGNSVTFKFKNDLSAQSTSGNNQGGNDEGQGNTLSDDPRCAGVTCGEGQDCFAGICQDLVPCEDGLCCVCIGDSSLGCPDCGQSCDEEDESCPGANTVGCTKNSDCIGQQVLGSTCQSGDCYCMFNDVDDDGKPTLGMCTPFTASEKSSKISETDYYSYYSAVNFCKALGSSLVSTSSTCNENNTSGCEEHFHFFDNAPSNGECKVYFDGEVKSYQCGGSIAHAVCK